MGAMTPIEKRWLGAAAEKIRADDEWFRLALILQAGHEAVGCDLSSFKRAGILLGELAPLVAA